MSHPGNDEIIDNERDNKKSNLEKEHEELTIETVIAATALGINVVQKIAVQSLKQKPGLSLKEFTQILDKYVDTMKNSNLIREKYKDKANTHT
jgi:hypothetical protein|tara:strand:- start:183 stop:461 length:279 start_codon:yes stop_codon:yes gene_type:complete